MTEPREAHRRLASLSGFPAIGRSDRTPIRKRDWWPRSNVSVSGHYMGHLRPIQLIRRSWGRNFRFRSETAFAREVDDIPISGQSALHSILRIVAGYMLPSAALATTQKWLTVILVINLLSHAGVGSQVKIHYLIDSLSAADFAIKLPIFVSGILLPGLGSSGSAAGFRRFGILSFR